MTSLPAPSKVKLGLVIDLDTCVGCHACAVACKEWNDGSSFGPLPDHDTRGAKPDGVWFNRVHTYAVQGIGIRDEGLDEKPGLGIGDWGLWEKQKGRVDPPSSRSTAVPNPESPISNPCSSNPESPIPNTGLTVHFPRSCLHCETPACVTVCPTGASYKRAEDGIVLVDEDKCIGCQLCSWACPYGAREFSEQRGVMQKCTLCVDRIYNETLAPADRQPACVMACPTRARHFGDLGDADSAVSKLVAARDGYALMPELGYQPVNRYLPPRPRRDSRDAASAENHEPIDTSKLSPLLRWVDRVLSR